jgi:hypothetical protein
LLLTYNPIFLQEPCCFWIKRRSEIAHIDSVNFGMTWYLFECKLLRLSWERDDVLRTVRQSLGDIFCFYRSNSTHEVQIPVVFRCLEMLRRQLEWFASPLLVFWCNEATFQTSQYLRYLARYSLYHHRFRCNTLALGSPSFTTTDRFPFSRLPDRTLELAIFLSRLFLFARSPHLNCFREFGLLLVLIVYRRTCPLRTQFQVVGRVRIDAWLFRRLSFVVFEQDRVLTLQLFMWHVVLASDLKRFLSFYNRYMRYCSRFRFTIGCRSDSSKVFIVWIALSLRVRCALESFAVSGIGRLIVLRLWGVWKVVWLSN